VTFHVLTATSINEDGCLWNAASCSLDTSEVFTASIIRVVVMEMVRDSETSITGYHTAPRNAPGYSHLEFSRVAVQFF
jgi:hypothetical protein